MNCRELDEKQFDILLEIAFNEKMKLDLAQLPSDEELERMYPYTRKRKREERRYVRIAKYRGQNIALVYAKRVAVIVLVATSVAFGLLMTDDGVRAAVGGRLREIVEEISPFKYEAEIEDVAEYHDEYVKMDFENVTVADPEKAAEEFDVANVEIGYIPEGYEYDYEMVFDGLRDVYYKNEIGEIITIRIHEKVASDLRIDSENHELTELKINGYDAFLSYSEERQDGSIIIGNEIYKIHITAVLPKEELIKIAKSIEY